MKPKRMDHTETSSTPSERCRTLAKSGQKRISFPSALTPVVATQTWVGWAPTLPNNHHLVLPFSNELETWTGPHLEISDHCRCNVRVAFAHHDQTVSPTGAPVRTRWHLQAPNHRLRKTRKQRPAHPLELKEFRGWCKNTSTQHCPVGWQTPLSNLV